MRALETPLGAQLGTMVVGTTIAPTEVHSRMQEISQAPKGVSRARMMLDPKCEDALNTQANIEMTVSMVYLALHHHFAADAVSLPGLAAHFLKEADEERTHSMQFMDYQTLRGGNVELQSIMMPKIEFPDSPRGDALYAMELSLALEKMNYEKLLEVHAAGEAAGDSQLMDFVESEFLEDQLNSIKEISDWVTQLRRVVDGQGEFLFDQSLL